ncbi:hypothetical protein E2C01_019172 [Portunus trituberculatus]|uniref:Uncharacterized protein n=1 Tax=Portunus trituberculatus TaxID=210409 RepID=A0A5B7DYI5_PORTR|nr:hypothetical protein [Portunus trituberculatus]
MITASIDKVVVVVVVVAAAGAGRVERLLLPSGRGLTLPVAITTSQTGLHDQTPSAEHGECPSLVTCTARLPPPLLCVHSGRIHTDRLGVKRALVLPSRLA